VYAVNGMTCMGCVASVKDKLMSVNGVQNVEVSLEKQEAKIKMEEHVPTEILQGALSSKYTISSKQDSEKPSISEMVKETSKLKQLKPLLLIFLYLFSAAILLNYKDWETKEFMLDFMGLFYIVFSFFKLLDLKGFPESFRMYDPLAKAVPFYGKVYPFLELVLGIFFLMRLNLIVALILTILILGITTFGVTKTLLDKKSIRCACLGTALKLPMTEATFIENAIMLVMAVWMLLIM
jgi:copper chaperone CopZ